MQVCQAAAPLLARSPATACELSATLLRLGAAELARGRLDDGADAVFAAADALERFGGSGLGPVPEALAAEATFYAGLVNLYHAASAADVLALSPHLQRVRP